jgi:hypothetical protein
MRIFTPLVAMLLLLASGTRSFALGYDRSQVEHDWAIDGPGGRYGLIQFAPYGPLVDRRTLVIFAGHSQEIPLSAPWAVALLGVFTLCGSFAVLCRSRRKT